MSDAAHTNSLIHETSPYLLQHAHNPVDWRAWNEETLAAARTAGKPILLSIGYSACHWCHVMAHESFEDAETAALMNRLFVNIKVDREERPDLDRVYQLAHQILTQRGGGWPLTVFLAPDDLTPFFAGTYFPREPRYGMPGFKEVLARVAEFYREHQAELHKQNSALQDVFKRIAGETAAPAAALADTPLLAAYRAFAQSFDPRFGGFGSAPKFPHATGLEFLLQYAGNPKTDAEAARQGRLMLETTLTRMAEGGIYDQLGGGFFRYSTDAQWTVPHFEKMLYDNALLLGLYAQAATFTGDALYRDIAHGTAEWVMREMQAPQGSYYSSLDADSEGREGQYYVWTVDEVRAQLSAEEYAVFAPRYGLEQPPNFEDHWHLHVQGKGVDTTTPFDPLSHRERGGDEGPETSARLQSPQPSPALRAPSPKGRGETGAETLLESARRKLLAARQKRARPGLDDKILTAWNGLMIRAMSMAGRLLDEPQYLDSAAQALDLICTRLWKDGRLLATWRDGQAKLPAYLDDYAFLLDGTLELLQARWDSEVFGFARTLADALLAHFEDREHGGFWFTADDQKILLYRSKTFSDESLPAGNAIAAHALLRLGHLCAEPRYLDAAERTLKTALPAVIQSPDAHAAMLLALQDALEPPTMVVLRGAPGKLIEWRRTLDRDFDPRRLTLAIPNETENLTGLLAECAPRGEICAYICRGTSCSLPITRLEDVLEIHAAATTTQING